MYANGSCELCEPRYRCFYFLAGSHDQVGKLIDYQHNIGQVTVALIRIQFSGFELVIILFDITDHSVFEQVIALVHLNT